jgi:hypothetical protein
VRRDICDLTKLIRLSLPPDRLDVHDLVQIGVNVEAMATLTLISRTLRPLQAAESRRTGYASVTMDDTLQQIFRLHLPKWSAPLIRRGHS